MKDGCKCGGGVLMVISGPAGSGKGTAVKLLRKMMPELSLSVSATTRSPRPGEKDGIHYFFITRDEFEARLAAGEILEHTEYCGNLYGTPAEGVRRVLDAGLDMVLEIEIDGASQIKRMFPDAVTVMLIPPDCGTLEARLRGRGTEPDSVIRERMQRARQEIAKSDDYDYIVVSYDGAADECAENLSSILKAEHFRRSRMAGVTGAFFDAGKAAVEK